MTCVMIANCNRTAATLSLLTAMAFAVTAHSQNDDISKYRIKRTNSKLAKSQAAKLAAQPLAPESLSSQAMKELTLAPDELTTGVLQTPATVRLRVQDVLNPMRPLAYRLGVSVQPFEPKGSMAVGNLAPYDLAQAGMRPMVAIEGQWLPMMSQKIEGLQAGVFASLGYAKHTLNLSSPTGAAIENTQLHSLKAQAGITASYQIPSSPLWSAHANLGLGRFSTIQSSTSSYANSSTTTWFGSLGLSAERSILPNLSVFLGYDYHLALARSAPGSDVPQHNVMFGFLGNFE